MRVSGKMGVRVSKTHLCDIITSDLLLSLLRSRLLAAFLGSWLLRVFVLSLAFSSSSLSSTTALLRCTRFGGNARLGVAFLRIRDVLLLEPIQQALDRTRGVPGAWVKTIELDGRQALVHEKQVDQTELLSISRDEGRLTFELPYLALVGQRDGCGSGICGLCHSENDNYKRLC